MSYKMLDLFAEASSRLPYCANIVSPEEERALIGSLAQAELAPFRFQGWLGKRLTASFGWRYDFDTGSFAETEPLPSWLLPLRDRASAFAGCDRTNSSTRS